jgi:hypothetical protein
MIDYPVIREKLPWHPTRYGITSSAFQKEVNKATSSQCHEGCHQKERG